MNDDRLEDGGSTSVFRPSYSATTLGCPGSLIPSMKAVDTAGYDAAVGTVFHDLIAGWQLHGRPDARLGEIVSVDGHKVEIDEEMFIHAEECLHRTADIPGDRYVETRIDISSLTPIENQGGTCDLACCEPGVLEINDWKYGQGVKVYAEKNTQLLLYAYGFFVEYDWMYDFQTIRLRISQPRLDHWDVWEISRQDLLDFADWARQRWALAFSPNADRTPSPKACLWCKVRLDCPALEYLRQSLADDTFDGEDLVVSHEAQQMVVSADTPVVSLTPPAQLPTDRLARILIWRPIFEKWFADIAETLTQRGFQGDDLAGLWKVATGRPGNRKWVDEEAAAEALTKLGVDPYKQKLVSPAEAEKLLIGIPPKLKTKYVNLYTTRAPGKPTLVPLGDNRVNVISIIDQTFEGEDTDQSADL